MSTIEEVKVNIDSYKAQLQDAETPFIASKFETLLKLEYGRLAQLEKQTQVLAPPSPRCINSVFVFGEIIYGQFSPVGTCFAISATHIFTACHNLHPKSTPCQYAFAPVVSRTRGRVTCDHGYREVAIFRRNKGMDYAILEVSNHIGDLVPIPIADGRCLIGDIDLKVYHSPVRLYVDSVGDFQLPIHSIWVKAAIPGRHHVQCSGGVFKGSSGAPFVNRDGFVVGIHVESFNEAIPVDIPPQTLVEDAISMISDTINSNINVHASLCNALVLGKCPKLLEALQTLNIPIH